MRKKLFTFLLALVTSVGLMNAAVDGKLPGAFTVEGSGTQVYFSQGNLQATTSDNGSTWTWGFAEHQYDFIGDAVANNAINGGGTVSSNGAVDLFGWSSDDNNYFGIDNSTNLTDYDGNFQDWGTKMGSDWRTLTYDEWNYLLNTRVPGSSAASTSNPRFARAQIFTDGTAPSKDIYGLILFPDDFNDGGYIDGVTWNGINSYDAVSPTYCTTAGWATLESMGCVFLPASGWRSEGAVTNVGTYGIYWASTKSTETDEDASCMYFFSNNVAVFRSYFKTGASVRLVSETAPGGSTPATGLQVVEVTSDIYDGWNSNGNTFSVNALPGFQAVTFDEAKEWTGVPTSGTAVLVYRTNGDYARVIHFFDGTISGDYDLETDFNQMYENITLFGNRIFYTAGGSTPTPTTSGSCGANVTWEFNPSTGALTITGTGAMDDYLNNASTPWNSYITDITSVTITDGVTNVGNHSFEQCTSLTTVTIGDDVETIGTFAFSECGEQFTTLTLGNSIRTIGNQAFASNYGITGFTLPSTLETIGNFAFIHNKAITTLTIPSNVTSIDKDAFYGCTAVTDVYCYPNAADLTWNEVDCDDFKSGKATICHVNSDQLDAYQTKFNDVVRVTFVGDLDAPASNPHGECGAQGDNLLWELDPSTGVLTITGSGAMYDWPNNPETPWYDNIYQITSVVLPSGITTIGDFAFKGCTNLASINMTENYPAGLTAIKQQAFCHTALTSITIPESVVTIGMDAFRLSTDIENVYCYADPNNLTWNDYYCDDFKGQDHATVCHVKACALSTYEAKWGGTPYNVFNSTGVNVTFVGDLPGDCPAPTQDEQVPTNVDPENPSYHYSTFFHSTQNYKLSNDGTQAFIADLSNNELVLTEIAHGEQVIPANTAVILRKTGSADPVVLIPTAENGVSVNPDDNSLRGVDEDKTLESLSINPLQCYVLSGKSHDETESGVGFYLIYGNTLKAHKAYVIFAGGSNNAPKKMRFVYGQATGIEDVQGNNVQSTKVIENGQLFIIKNGVKYNAQGVMVK